MRAMDLSTYCVEQIALRSPEAGSLTMGHISVWALCEFIQYSDYSHLFAIITMVK
jgi:hypothetical protein